MQPVVPDSLGISVSQSSGAELTPASVNPGMPSARTHLLFHVGNASIKRDIEASIRALANDQRLVRHDARL